MGSPILLRGLDDTGAEPEIDTDVESTFGSGGYAARDTVAPWAHTGPVRGEPALDAEPRSPKGRRTRARLLDAGKAVFERDGFLQARISDIAAEANVSHGAFYHYFESKESLFVEVATVVEAALITLGDAPPHGGRISAIDRVRAANRSYLEAYQKEARIMRVIEEVARYNPDVRQIRETRGHHYAERVEAGIARLQAEGHADPRIDPVYAARALGGMVARFAEYLFVESIPLDLDTGVEQLTVLWSNALGLEERRSKRKLVRPVLVEVSHA
jgi:AcrR family transcriptional regulator